MLYSDYIDRLPSNGFFLFNDKYFEAKIVTIYFSLNFNGNNYPLCVNKVTKSFFDKYICSFCYYKENENRHRYVDLIYICNGKKYELLHCSSCAFDDHIVKHSCGIDGIDDEYDVNISIDCNGWAEINE
jgi:hypothetical protein